MLGVGTPNQMRDDHPALAERFNRLQVREQKRAQEHFERHRLVRRRAEGGVEQVEAPAIERGDIAIEDGAKQRLLRSEVIVRGGHVDAGGGSDRADRGGFEPTFSELPLGGIDQAFRGI